MIRATKVSMRKTVKLGCGEVSRREAGARARRSQDRDKRPWRER